MAPNRVELPEAFQELWTPSRYKAFWGGRGGAKSRSFGRTLLLMSLEKAKELAPKPDDSTIHPQYRELLEVAGVMAAVAQAEALERIADRLEHNTAHAYTGPR